MKSVRIPVWLSLKSLKNYVCTKYKIDKCFSIKMAQSPFRKVEGVSILTLSHKEFSTEHSRVTFV